MAIQSKNKTYFTTEAQRKAFRIVNCACGAVNKVKLCASVVKYLLVFACQANRN